VFEWALDRTGTMQAARWRGAFGPSGQGAGAVGGPIEGFDEMVTQLHAALQQLSTGEPFDIIQDVGKGSGFVLAPPGAPPRPFHRRAEEGPPQAGSLTCSLQARGARERPGG
jgi:hypothetical protein